MLTGVWNDRIIRDECRLGLVEPFAPELINPASIDLRLGNEFINLKTRDKFKADKVIVTADAPLLATTLERVRIPNYVAAQLSLKSTMARNGLDHSLAGWIDPGFIGEVTLELSTHLSGVYLEAGIRIVQLTFFTMAEEPEKSYCGRYQYQAGPMGALKEKR